jgi:hypothetical protein
MYHFPGSLVQFLCSLKKSYLIYALHQSSSCIHSSFMGPPKKSMTGASNVTLFAPWHSCCDRLCRLAVNVPGSRPRGPKFDSRPYQTS